MYRETVKAGVQTEGSVVLVRKDPATASSSPRADQPTPGQRSMKILIESAALWT